MALVHEMEEAAVSEERADDQGDERDDGGEGRRLAAQADVALAFLACHLYLKRYLIECTVT